MRKFFPLMLRKHSIPAVGGVGAMDRLVEAILQDKAKQEAPLPGEFPLCQNPPRIFRIFSEGGYSILPYWSPLSASQEPRAANYHFHPLLSRWWRKLPRMWRQCVAELKTIFPGIFLSSSTEVFVFVEHNILP